MAKAGLHNPALRAWARGHQDDMFVAEEPLPAGAHTHTVGKGARHVTKGGNSLPAWYNLPPSPDRWKIRSATFPGIAKAMAAQWTRFVIDYKELI